MHALHEENKQTDIAEISSQNVIFLIIDLCL